jgi:uncharacterized BrkB/YihY/UPF0761 family membrane protein
MSEFTLTQIGWMLATLLVVSVQIISSVLLLREKHIGPWLMLAGSVITLIGSLVMRVGFAFFLDRIGMHLSTYQWVFTAISAFSYFGSFLFGLGLLLYALRQKGRADRIAELEAILHSRHQND